MKLPSKIKGWLNPKASPETLLSNYYSTGKSHYLALLVEQFNVSLFHYLLSLSDKCTAEDALQSTWLKVMKTKPSAQHTHVKSWLYTIARNTLIDELRRQQKWQSQPITEDQLMSENLERVFIKDNQLALFNEMLMQLPFHQREAFIFQQEGFSVLEICHLVDENFETIKSRLRYARNHFKIVLGKEL